ncbi:MAG: HEAT repeat domain-containing protein [Planctomycetota bacterium]
MRPLCLLLLCLAVARAEDHAEALLRENGIRPEPEALRAYFRSLYPDEKTRRLTAALVARLGAEATSSREEATQRLAALNTASLAELKKVAATSDPEVRRIARELLDRMLRRVRRDVLLAALRTVERHRFPGLVDDVLQTVPLAADLSLLPAAERALKATARPTDIPRLRAALAAEETHLRAAAVLALGGVLADPALSELHALLQADRERVRLAAAWALADRGDRTGFATFGELLEAQDTVVRRRSARALRHISGQTFGYSPHADDPGRARATAAWRAWLAAHGGTVTWQPPLAPAARLLGRTLIAVYSQSHVLEVGPPEVGAQARILWETRTVRRPWAVQGLPNGHRLVVEYATKSLVEFDAQGREIWRRTGLPGYVSSVQRLDNGNTLLVLSNPGKLLEMRLDGTTAWELVLAGFPTHAERLENGHFLVVLSQHKKIVEMDRDGKIVWSLAGLRHPWSAQRLANGNTLVCDLGAGQVQEFDRAGRVVWSHAVSQSYDARRLPNGHTLLADRRGVREIDLAGREHWLFKSKDFLRVSRY